MLISTRASRPQRPHRSFQRTSASKRPSVPTVLNMYMYPSRRRGLTQATAVPRIPQR